MNQQPSPALNQGPNPTLNNECDAEPVELLDIIYQDEHLVAINKPSGLLVHRSWLDKAATQLQTRQQIGAHCSQWLDKIVVDA